MAINYDHNYYWNGSISTTSNYDSSATTNWDPVEVRTDWFQGNVEFAKKRRRFLGKKESDKPNYEAKIFFNILKKGLKKMEQKRFKELAEKAFEEALKCEGINQKSVQGKIEEKMVFYLKKAAIQTMKYDRIVTEKMIDGYRDTLPKTKELVIDEISEYEKPLPRHAQVKLKKAKDAKIFDSFWIFWIQEVKDPILFGQIEEEKDVYYFIDEWNKDISIDDLLKYK